MSQNKIKIKYVISDNLCMLSCGDIYLNMLATILNTSIKDSLQTKYALAE